MPPEENSAEEAAETTEEVADAPVTEAEAVKEQEQTEEDLADRIANRVYDKIKAFTTDLVTASQNVEQLVSESVAAKQEEVAPAEEAAEDAEIEGTGDVKPKRSHKLFARPGRKE